MSRRDPRPPALARRLLEWAGRKGATPDLADDADELFAQRADKLGEPAARSWYWRQTRDAVARLMLPQPPRPGRRPAWMTGFSLDARLGVRMLTKYPGVTFVGLAAMAIGIGLGAGYLEIVDDLLRPTLPLDEGDRIVGLQNWDLEANDPDLRSLHDFTTWREELTSVRELGAFRSIERNLGDDQRPAEPAYGAAISPTAFMVARVPAHLGRTLIDSDDRPGAPSVIVLGYDLWRTRFDSDAGVVGDTVRLGEDTATVVGVMPEGFAFPVSHRFWIPLQPDPEGYAPLQGPSVNVFGRLASGVSLAEARAELVALGTRTSAEFPETHELLRPQVMPYVQLFVGAIGDGDAYLVQGVFVLLVLVLSSNVATMMFARTATRQSEIAMRFALGARRSQILAQFFVESLVLALVAAALGLAAASWATSRITLFLWEFTQAQVPFWLDGGLNGTTIAYALVLAIASALVAGVLPALKATRTLQASLRSPADVSAGNMRFGGLWSAAIVVQVALAVLVLPPAIVAISALSEADSVDPGFAGDEYLSARIEMEPSHSLPDAAARSDAFATFEATREELRRLLEAEPGVTRVTFGDHLPGMNHPQPVLEIEGEGDVAQPTGEVVMTASIEADFFDAFGAEIVAGRGFEPADLRSDRRIVVVNQHFVDEALQGRSAIGRRVRIARFGDPEPWSEIVGVVNNLGMDTAKEPFWPGYGPGVYSPLRPAAMQRGDTSTVRVAFHVQGDAATFAPRLREIAFAVNSELRLYDVLALDGPVDRVNQGQRQAARLGSWVTALVALMALLISIAGTYSVMSFTVARQTREIGIRVALGADRRRVITGIFSRAITQIAAGVLVGAVVWAYLIVYQLGGSSRVGLLFIAVGALLLVGAAACGVPMARALRIEPTEALRDGT